MPLVTLYKGADSKLLHSVDVPGWLGQGWTMQPTPQSTPQDPITDEAGLINVNSASLEELVSVTGIGSTTAQKIIDMRPIESLDVLKSISRVDWASVLPSLTV